MTFFPATLTPETRKSFQLCDNRISLEAELHQHPQRLLRFFKEAVLDADWLKREASLAKRLIQDLTDCLMKQQMDIGEARHISEIFRTNYARVKGLLHRGLRITEGNDHCEVSRLVLIASGDYFRGMFLHAFQEAKVDILPIEKFASDLTLPQWIVLYAYMESGDSSGFQKAEMEDLWAMVKQCHLWQLDPVVDFLEKQIMERVDLPVVALECISGAEFYGLKKLRTHCFSVLGENDLSFSVRKDGSLSAIVRDLTEEKLEIMETLTQQITHVSLFENSLRKKPVSKLVKEIEGLESICLIVSEGECSKAAQKALKNVPRLRKLKLRAGEFPQLKGFPASPLFPKRGEHQSPHFEIPQVEQLDLRGSTKKLKHHALSMIAILPGLLDIRLQGAAFVDLRFVEHLVKLAPPLKLLDMGNCHGLNDQAVRLIADHFPHLEVVNLRGTSVEAAGVCALMSKCNHLHDLNLAGCRGIHPGLFSMIEEALPRLSFLNIDGCTQFKEADLASLASKATHLRILHAERCPGVTAESLKLPGFKQLMELWISSGFLPQEADWETPFGKQAMPNLRKLVISGQLLPVDQEKLMRFRNLNPEVDVRFHPTEF